MIVPIETIPKFQRVELFLFNWLTQLGIPSDIKKSVNPTNKTIGNPKAINNSIKKRGFYPSKFRSIVNVNFP